ncbi:MAG: hypothetical protein WC212_00430 [Candidatus Delongbacteria bacterium]
MQFDQSARKLCLKKGKIETPSWNQCNQFESKVSPFPLTYSSYILTFLFITTGQNYGFKLE